MVAAIAKRDFQDTRSKILWLLKLKGPMTADELSQELNITYMGVRQHLTPLEHDGLVQHNTEQRGPGRPSYVYSLTDLGDESFPRRYRQLASSLLDAIRAVEGEEGVERVFEKRTQWLEAQYRINMADKDLQEQVRQLARIRSEEGYMAGWERRDTNTFVLRERNCAIRQVAECCAQACRYELELFRRVVNGAEVWREEHILQGGKACSYVIQRKHHAPEG